VSGWVIAQPDACWLNLQVVQGIRRGAVPSRAPTSLGEVWLPCAAGEGRASRSHQPLRCRKSI